MRSWPWSPTTACGPCWPGRFPGSGRWRAVASRSRFLTPARTPCWLRPRGTGWTRFRPCWRSSGPRARRPLAAMWSGLTPTRAWSPRRSHFSAAGARHLHRRGEPGGAVGGDERPEQAHSGARDPAGMPFDPPEQKVITWNVALNADELIGLLGTFSWVILMEDGPGNDSSRRRAVSCVTYSASRATRRSTWGTGPRCSRRAGTTERHVRLGP